MNKQTVSQEFSKTLVVISADASIASAAQLMETHHIRHLPVTDHDKIVGIISDRDVLRATKSEFYAWGEQVVEDREFDDRSPVRNYMSAPVVSVDFKSTLVEVAQKMITLRISSVLITKDHTPVGIITTEDLLGVIVKHFSEPQDTKCACPKKASLMTNPIELYFDDQNAMGIHPQRRAFM